MQAVWRACQSGRSTCENSGTAAGEGDEEGAGASISSAAGLAGQCAACSAVPTVTGDSGALSRLLELSSGSRLGSVASMRREREG